MNWPNACSAPQPRQFLLRLLRARHAGTPVVRPDRHLHAAAGRGPNPPRDALQASAPRFGPPALNSTASSYVLLADWLPARDVERP